MMKITSTHVIVVISIVGLLLLVGSKFLVTPPEQSATTVAPGTYTELATCIKESGAKFFGAFWCPHCQDQKEMFGDASSQLPYIECSNPDKQSQTQACIDADITGYPTWEFKDGTRLDGTLSLQKLSEQTNCALPL